MPKLAYLKGNKKVMEEVNLMVEVDKYLAKYFDTKAYKYPRPEVGINNRLKAVLGRYGATDDEPYIYRIELSGSAVVLFDYDELLDVLYHEVIHHALYVRGLPADDTDEFFIGTCQGLGVGLTGEGPSINENQEKVYYL